MALSVDHKPNAKEERARIEAVGGVVVWAGTWRVGGVLAVSRAFGDRPLKRYVSATPDMADETLTAEDEFLILASDGLWDVMTNQVREGGSGRRQWWCRAWGYTACSLLLLIFYASRPA